MAVPNAVLLPTTGDGQQYFGQPEVLEEMSATSVVVTSYDGSQVVVPLSFADVLAAMDATWGALWHTATFSLVGGKQVVFGVGDASRVWVDENAPLARSFVSMSSQAAVLERFWHVQANQLTLASAMWP